MNRNEIRPAELLDDTLHREQKPETSSSKDDVIAHAEKVSANKVELSFFVDPTTMLRKSSD